MTGTPIPPLTANPSAIWLSLVAVLAVLAGLVALLPALLLVASLAGLLGINPTVELSFLAVPTTAVGLVFIVAGLSIASDLCLPHPVLLIDAEGVFDRRVSDRLVRWSEIVEAVLAPGGGAVQLALNAPLETRVSPYRAGTLGIRGTPAGLMLIPIRGMNRPAVQIAESLLTMVARQTSEEGAA